MPESSTQVLDRFRQGDADAFEELFREQQGSVYRWILRIVRDRGTAEDLTVETFWKIYRAHARFDAARGFEPWAKRIATHVALDWLRAAAVLAVVEEQPHKVVAESLGISVAAVKLRVFRALRLLRKDLEQQGIRP
jgi:RNA polymerase sigma-70 factor (ECF subfamily)